MVDSATLWGGFGPAQVQESPGFFRGIAIQLIGSGMVIFLGGGEHMQVTFHDPL